MTSSFEGKLLDVTGDRKSGAWVVARKAIDTLEALVAERKDVTAKVLVTEIEQATAQILKSQPGMAQLINLFNELFEVLDGASDDQVALSRKVSGELTRFGESAHRAVDKVAQLGADLISTDTTVLVHSNSSTVMEVLKKAHEQGKEFQVIVSESRPMSEGRSCAAELAQMSIDTIYLIDAAMSLGVERADIILLGGDSLSESELVNKIGSKSICLLAREAVVPCYAAIESSKFMPQKLNPKKAVRRDSDEVWDSPPSNVLVENYYFDEIPVDLFTGIITEGGMLTPEEIGGKIREKKLSKRLLQVLK